MVRQCVNIYPRLSKSQFKIVDTLCFLSKNLYNVGLYNIRQHYHASKLAKPEMSKLRPDITRNLCILDSSYIPYSRGKDDPFKDFSNYNLSKNNDNYKLLHSDCAQQTLKRVEKGYKTFFALLEMKLSGKYNHKVNPPHYLDKNGRYELTYPKEHLSIKGNTITLGLSNLFKKQNDVRGSELTFTIPSSIKPHQIKEVKVIPIHNGKCYKLSFSYEVKQIPNLTLDKTKYLGIDLGVNNFATILDNATGTATIIDGKYLKSLNRWYNKENARLQSIKDKQGIISMTNKQHKLLIKRENRINEAMNRYVTFIIDHVIKNKIGNIVFPTWKGIKSNRESSKSDNQNFIQIPYNKFRIKLKTKCKYYGIEYIDKKSEDYTSRTDALAFDDIKDQPYGKSRRIKRGLYKSITGHLINSDVNGSMNHIRNVAGNAPVEEIVSRGLFNRPVRVRISYEVPVILSERKPIRGVTTPFGFNPLVKTDGS